MDVLISVDYEVAGDGSGDPKKQIIEPTEYLLRLMSNAGLVATFFIEVEELRSFQKWQPRTFTIIKNQLERMVTQGHEIALHLHPQWRYAKFNSQTNAFLLSASRSWVLGVDEKDGALVDYLQESRQLLNSWIGDSCDSFNVQGFRAGGYSSHDYLAMLDALIEAGFSYDASPLMGARRSGAFCEYDYTEFVGPACVGRQFCLLPVSSSESSKAQNFSARTFLRGGQAISRQGRQDLGGKNPLQSLQRLFECELRPLDWTTLNHRRFSAEMQARAIEPYLSVIGHTKTAVHKRGLEKKLEAVRDYAGNVVTNAEYAKTLLSRED